MRFWSCLKPRQGVESRGASRIRVGKWSRCRLGREMGHNRERRLQMGRIFSTFLRTVYRTFLHKRFFRVSLLLSIVAERYLDFFTPVTVAVLVGVSGCRRNLCPVVLMTIRLTAVVCPHLCYSCVAVRGKNKIQLNAQIDPWCCSDHVRRKLPEKNRRRVYRRR